MLTEPSMSMPIGTPSTYTASATVPGRDEHGSIRRLARDPDSRDVREGVRNPYGAAVLDRLAGQEAHHGALVNPAVYTP